MIDEWIDHNFLFGPEIAVQQCDERNLFDLVFNLQQEVEDWITFDAIVVFNNLAVIDLTGCIDSEVV